MAHYLWPIHNLREPKLSKGGFVVQVGEKVGKVTLVVHLRRCLLMVDGGGAIVAP